MAGWRGSSGSQIINDVGKNYLRISQHGAGGILGINLSPELGTVNQQTGQEVISNTATLPTRGSAAPTQSWQPRTIPGEPNQVSSGVPGVQTGRAYGNPGNVTQAAKSRSGWPGNDKPAPGPSAGGQVGNNQPGGEAGLWPMQPFPHVSALGVGQETSWRGGLFFSNDMLQASDRHAIMNTGTERGGGRGSGETDPPMDGPARPSLRLINRTINFQIGSDATRNQDEEPGENRNYAESASTKPFAESAKVGWGPRAYEPGNQYVGEQGTGWSPVYGGVPNLWQPYGSYAGYTANEVRGIQSPAAPGTPGDGPQLVFSGLPHGLHSQTYPDYSSTLGRYLAVPQMQQPRQDRPSNSTIGGQAFNQLVVPQGQVGTAAVQRSGVTEMGPTQAGQSANASQSWRGSVQHGWRGIRPGGQQT